MVVQVHGGGWILGSRASGITASLVSGFLKKDIAFATIDYRLADAPRAIQDVACAIRYLRASAARLKINPKRVGAMGQSAGGQLVSLLGTSDPAAGFDVGQYLNESSRVRAVVDEWGPVIFDATLQKKPYVLIAFGTTNLQALQKYAPLTYVSKDDPPFLVVHGAEDTQIPLYQSKDFVSGLKKGGVSAKLIVSQHAGHQLVPVGGTPKPSVKKIQASVVSFFVSHLAR